MADVRQIAEEIVAREGGFVNDPDDPGGATNHGVTIHTLRRLGIDVNRDTRIDVADVRTLTRSQAVAIYLDHYSTRPGLAALRRLPRFVFTHSALLEGEVRPLVGGASWSLPNGVDASFFAPEATKSTRSDGETLVVGWAGSVANFGAEMRGLPRSAKSKGNGRGTIASLPTKRVLACTTDKSQAIQRRN